MNRDKIRARIEEIGIVPAIRVASAEDALFAAKTISDCGIPIAEVTMTTPGAINVISEMARTRPELTIGAGTIIDLDTARRCLDAGAQFLTSPGLDTRIVEFAIQHDVVAMPGAMTPSEIMAASSAGAHLVKVFPCSLLGGASYIRTLKSPFPNVKLIASGGVTQGNVADFILAGAAGVGIGRDLINPEAVQRRQPDWICELAGRFVQIIAAARSRRMG